LGGGGFARVGHGWVVVIGRSFGLLFDEVLEKLDAFRSVRNICGCGSNSRGSDVFVNSLSSSLDSFGTCLHHFQDGRI
jgi:hypothetical protein